jgi:hypothetical protein
LEKVLRIEPLEARQKVAAGDALLVCAYENEGEFKHLQLENAVSFHTFKKLLAGLSPDKEIIFYCN